MDPILSSSRCNSACYIIDRPRRIFCLGDSRTGTTSLHHFFMANNYASEHGFASAIAPCGPITISSVFRSIDTIKSYPNTAWQATKEYIYKSPAIAFSDYPIRIFWKELYQEFENALFILTKRCDASSWRGSMERVFAEEMPGLDFEKLEREYIVTNDEISQWFGDKPDKLMVLTAEDKNDYKTKALASFLGLPNAVKMGHYNTL